MSAVNTDAEEILDEKGGFFIAPNLDSEWDEGDNVDHQMLILQKADALASENRLKEALDVFTMALRYGSVRPEQLSTLVDCILRNFKKKNEGVPSEPPHKTQSEQNNVGNLFNCPGCHRFLGEPVTVACGHSYCKRCLHRELFSRCKLCREDLTKRSEHLRPNVILSMLLHKWFPDETDRCKRIEEIEELTKIKRFEEAVTLANNVVKSDPGDALARVCRAEAFAGLKQHALALADLEELWPRSSGWPEAYFQKARILQVMGQTDDSLQVFLQCLALDEDFTLAKKEVEKVLCDLLSPACQNVKVGLRETALVTSPNLWRKTAVPDDGAPEQTGPQEKEEAPSRSESLERSGLSRAQSMRAHGHSAGPVAEEGLKRVWSAPQLGNQDKGALLKRKLSASEAGHPVVWSGGNKHKKQGEAVAVPDGGAATCRTVPEELLEANDFECSLCMRLFYQPVTTPCGHTYCKSCLERCLDHNPQCPLCKKSLKEYLASRKYEVTCVLDEVIKQYLPAEHRDRQKAHLEETKELSDLTKNVPVFVCTMAYPTVPCPLHVFEPRYRLMIRRCMETGTRQFGMCISDPQKGFADYGCMLQIRSVHFLPDGRSVVDTVGGKRFRVLSRGMRDGYSIADIDYLEDVKVKNSEELAKLQELHDRVYEQARTWFQNLKSRFRGQILQHFGPMPEKEADIQATPNGPACCWWLLAVLPVDPRYQLSVLSMMSLRERLVKIQHILTYLQSVPNQ